MNNLMNFKKLVKTIIIIEWQTINKLLECVQEYVLEEIYD